MSLHDRYARRTPYELLLPERSKVATLIGQIDEESEARGIDAADLHAFQTLGSVAAVLEQVKPSDAPAEAVHPYTALLYHAVSFARAGQPLYLLTTHAARYLVEGAPEAEPRPTASAGYLQLPQHLFWTDATGSGTPDSVDGIFWTVTPAGLLHALLATGLRSDRAGIGVVPLPEAPVTDAEQWLAANVRGQGSDYAADLPGAELDGLYAFQAAGEVFKLLARFFSYAGSGGASLEGHPASDASEATGGPEPSGLPYVRVTIA